MARIAVVGAGVVGVTSAYLLCRQGHEVVLVDRHAGPALGTSRLNGAQLSYAYCDALASPALLRHMPGIVLGRDPAYRVRLQADPDFLIWGLRFLANCSSGRFAANTRHLSEMAATTRSLLTELLSEFAIPFDYDVSGKMILYSSAASFEAGAEVRRLKQSLGVELETLDRSQASAIEPALALYADPIDRVVYSPGDAAGRPDLFAAGLVDCLSERYGLQTIFGDAVTSLLSHRDKVTGLKFAIREPIHCDRVVLATGYAATLLSDRARGMVWPVQGYSFTARATSAAMRVSVTDLKRKIVFARLGDDIRVAGLADIGARRFTFSNERFETFRDAATSAFGGAFNSREPGDVAPWTEGRPCTPSSRPIVRAGRLKGLYLNLGHGTLGWTLCLGSASQLLDVMHSIEDG